MRPEKREFVARIFDGLAERAAMRDLQSESYAAKDGADSIIYQYQNEGWTRFLQRKAGKRR